MVRTAIKFWLAMAAILLSNLAGAAAQKVEFQQGASAVAIVIAGQPFGTYHFDPQIAKPFLAPLRSARGTIVTRGFPMDPLPGEPTDEPHQRGLFFAHGLVNGYDFWDEAAFAKWAEGLPFGRTVFRKIDTLENGAEAGTLAAEFDLVGPDGQAFAEETQTYIFRGDADARLVDCDFVIRATHVPVVLGDTKEGTFAIRLAKELSPPPHMVNSQGGEGEKEIWGKRADWVDYDGTVAGEELGVAIFDSPANFRHPTTWHARGYGLLSANPFGLKAFLHDPAQDGTVTLPPGGSLCLRYRVYIHHGDYRQAQVAEAYRQYAAGK
jgi:hypothetical protein